VKPVVFRLLLAFAAAALMPSLVALLSGCQGSPGSRVARPASAQPVDYSDPDRLYQLVSKQMEKYVLVDVRTKEEYLQSHIPTAVNIPYYVIGQSLPATDRSSLIIVYCSSGVRSAAAKTALDKLGYTNVVDFGAMSRWKGAVLTSYDPGKCPCNL